MIIVTPFFKGTYYPSYDPPIGTAGYKFANFTKKIRQKHKVTEEKLCCGAEAIIQHHLNKKELVMLDRYSIKILAKDINFPVYLSWVGNPYVYIDLLNSFGLSCVFDGGVNDPIVILPDNFELDFYKNV